MDFRVSEMLNKSISIDASWNDNLYWQFFEDVAKFINKKNYIYTVPYVKRGGLIISKLTKEDMEKLTNQ